MGMFSSISRNIQNTLSGATFGIVPRDTSGDVTSESFESKLNKLRQSGAMGSQSNESLQNTNFGNIDTGFNLLTEQGSNIKGGQSRAADLFNQSMADSTQAIAAQSQLAPVDSALALRNAQDLYDQQRTQALNDAALVKASEMQQGASQLGNIGSTLAGQYSDAFNTNMFVQSGLEANRSSNQMQQNIQAQDLANKQGAALTGALSSTAQSLFNSDLLKSSGQPSNVPQGMGTGTAAMIDANQFNQTPKNTA